jgi:N-acetyl-gamma-glutamyl-phosphate reductase/acetylglutamate kinase
VKGDSSPSFTGSHEDRDGVKKYKVGLLGARGYVGREVIRLIGAHPNLELVCASSRALVGQRVLDIANAPPLNPHSNLPAIPNDRTPPLDVSEDLKFCDLGLEQIPTSPFGDEVDVWILALPNGYCDKYATALDGLRKENKIIIDLSADQRFNDKWVYGLPEASSNRMKLKGSSHIANPGCYATGAQLGILPLLGEHFDSSIPPHVFGVSGYSGAGTAPSNANNPAVLHDNILAYKSVNHIHEREISHQLGTPVRFMPHVAPFFQGIHLTISVQLKDHKLNENSILQIYNEFYANEYLVNVTPSIPLVKDNARKHQSTVGGFQFDNKSGRLAVIVTIDNLFKGAATQAVQNINISLGIDEYTALTDTN